MQITIGRPLPRRDEHQRVVPGHVPYQTVFASIRGTPRCPIVPLDRYTLASKNEVGPWSKYTAATLTTMDALSNDVGRYIAEGAVRIRPVLNIVRIDALGEPVVDVTLPNVRMLRSKLDPHTIVVAAPQYVNLPMQDVTTSDTTPGKFKSAAVALNDGPNYWHTWSSDIRGDGQDDRRLGGHARRDLVSAVIGTLDSCWSAQLTLRLEVLLALGFTPDPESPYEAHLLATANGRLHNRVSGALTSTWVRDVYDTVYVWRPALRATCVCGPGCTGHDVSGHACSTFMSGQKPSCAYITGYTELTALGKELFPGFLGVGEMTRMAYLHVQQPHMMCAMDSGNIYVRVGEDASVGDYALSFSTSTAGTGRRMESVTPNARSLDHSWESQEPQRLTLLVRDPLASPARQPSAPHNMQAWLRARHRANPPNPLQGAVAHILPGGGAVALCTYTRHDMSNVVGARNDAPQCAVSPSLVASAHRVHTRQQLRHETNGDASEAMSTYVASTAAAQIALYSASEAALSSHVVRLPDSDRALHEIAASFPGGA